MWTSGDVGFLVSAKHIQHIQPLKISKFQEEHHWIPKKHKKTLPHIAVLLQYQQKGNFWWTSQGIPGFIFEWKFCLDGCAETQSTYTSSGRPNTFRQTAALGFLVAWRKHLPVFPSVSFGCVLKEPERGKCRVFIKCMVWVFNVFSSCLLESIWNLYLAMT